jgi:hypothetical protein
MEAKRFAENGGRMKADSEKLKSRTSISMDDEMWRNVVTAAKVRKIPISEFLRDVVNISSRQEIASDAARHRASGKRGTK